MSIMWKYLGFRQNHIDPSPKARAMVGAGVAFVFKFAEYTLVAGVFAYLAATTKHWAVIAITIVLGVLLTAHLLTLVTGMQYILWQKAENKALKFLLCVADAAIFFAVYYTLAQAFLAVFKTMRDGVGI